VSIGFWILDWGFGIGFVERGIKKFTPHHSSSSVNRSLSSPSIARAVPLLLSFFLLTLASAAAPRAALAQRARLGVVKNPENAAQWAEIHSRLQAAGVDYCFVNLADINPNANLSDLKVLFLPNIETIDGAQVSMLQTWMGQGGQVIVSGPMGALSQPQVRSQLRSLLGAYWGFPLTNPATLEPLRVRSQEWARQAISSTLRGGVIIPAGLNSQTAAIWKAEGTPPAVVVTDRATFFGWRWGTDVVATTELDVAWLRAALSRYGGIAQGSSGQSNPCLASAGSSARKPPSSPQATRPNPPSSPQATRPNPSPSVPSGSASPPAVSAIPPRPPSVPLEQLILDRDAGDDEEQSVLPRGTEISAVGAQQMRRDLENLIGRWESAQLIAEAAQQENVSMSAAIEQFLRRSDKGANPQGLRRVHPAIADARAGLQRFEQFVNQRNYTQAQQQWEQIRNALLDSYPANGPIRYPEVRSMWFDRGTIVKARSKADLAKMFDRLAAAGINTIFFETLNASYPIYPSQVAPEQNPLVRGWDPLAAAVELAHERGMELHAWVWVFAAANQRHNTVMGQPTDYLGPVLSRHRDWIMTDKQGNLFERNKKAFFDPANPQVRQYLFSLLEEIATRYDVDGIQLDYIRYPFQDPSVHQTYGYGVAARSQFQQLTGVDPIAIYPNNPLWQRWTQFRIQQVDSFVAEAAQRLRAKRPDLLLSAAVFPMPRAERLARLQQNWEAWIERGEMDLLAPMTYALETESFQRIAVPLFEARSPGGTLLLPGIRLLRLPTAIALDQVQLLRDLPAGGYALFAAENLGLNLETSLRQTQSAPRNTRPDPLPQRQPFQAANARYQALQREWLVLLSNEQLAAIDETTLKQWGTQADILAAALKKLAETPNANNLRVAQRTLATFEEQFSTLMRPQAQAQPYQVQVWENRLDAIARLLRYGERRVRN
jgi:uncharacterized lipoprotein YddW (UPF0748 family)